jgi:hypothetical protein
MELVTAFYLVNATLLLLHEIESAYEKEWEILKLPGTISGFLTMHIPLILLLFYGMLEIDKHSHFGLILGIISGIGGLIPFLVHKILVRRKDHFNLLISNIVIYLNIIAGIGTLGLSLHLIL